MTSSGTQQTATSRQCKCGLMVPIGATRCPRGHVKPIVGLPGNAMKFGHSSALVAQGLLPSQAARRATLGQKRRQILSDLGGEENTSEIKADLVQRYLETSLVAEHLGEQLVEAGLFTAKGRLRAAFSAYLQVSDRLLRLAMALGLERRSKRVPSPLDYIEGR